MIVMRKHNILIMVSFIATGGIYIIIRMHVHQQCFPESVKTKEKTLNGSIWNPDARKLDLIFRGHSTVKINPNATREAVDTEFFRYISFLHYHCHDYVRLGNAFDGGWDICMAGPFSIQQPCLIYSFGINNDFSFDDAASIKLGCTIRAYDPSMAAQDHQRSPNIWFYKIGIGDSDTVNNKGWKLKTLDILKRENNETNATIDYLKFDVEGAEWNVIERFVADNSLTKVKQLGFEIHVFTRNVVNLHRFWSILDKLENIGFRRWYWAMNYRFRNIEMENDGARSCCYEMVYINTNYLTNASNNVRF